MRRLTLLGVALVSACWSEADFRAKCEAAGNCVAPEDAGVVRDAGAASDAGVVDAGVVDAGVVDAGVVDAGVVDAGAVDAGAVDAGVVDAGVVVLPDGGLTWAAVSAELFNTANTNSGIEVLAFPVPAPAKSLGGVLTPRGTVVCIPSSGHVLEVFPDGGVSSIAFVDAGTLDYWQGGVLLPDGGVVGFPHSNPQGTPVLISTAGLTSLSPALAGLKPFTEGGVITTDGTLIIMPARHDRFTVRSNGQQSEVAVDAGVAAVTGSAAFFSSAVLRASGTTALAVPNVATAVWEVSATGATPLGPLSGYAGGLLLPNGDALLMPFGGARLARVDTFNGVTAQGPITTGYFSAAWSTNGFGYAIQTVRSAGAYLTIARDGSVTESALPASAGLPDGGTVATNSVLSATSRFGLVAFPDGRLVSCPYADNRLVFIVPNGRRTVPDWVVLSPWLNKW